MCTCGVDGRLKGASKATGTGAASAVDCHNAGAHAAREPGAVMSSLSGCAYITLLLFLEMHWREILSPISSVKAKRVLLTWASFWALNIGLYITVIVSVYVEYAQSHGTRDLYWSNAYGRNCAIARPNNGIYHPNHIAVQIWTTNFGNAVTDGWGNTNYTKYAGPVSIVSPSCVSVQGGFDYDDGAYEEGWAKVTNVYC